MRDEVEDVEPGDALRLEHLRGEGLRLLQQRGEQIARLHFALAGALHVEHGGLEHAAERQRLLGLALGAAAELLDVLLEIAIELGAQLAEIDTARGEDLLALDVVGEHVEQVLGGEVGVTPRRGLTLRDAEQQSRRRRKTLPRHSSSMLARSGKPCSRASSCTP